MPPVDTMRENGAEPEPQTESRPRQRAVYSFAVAGAAALVLAGFWWLVHPGASRVAAQRRVTDLVVSWRCPNGHVFEERGRYEVRKCPECGRRVDIAVTYVCAIDGEHPARIRIITTPDGREAISEVSFKERLWRQVQGTVVCPECNSRMSPKRDDPFSSPSEPSK